VALLKGIKTLSKIDNSKPREIFTVGLQMLDGQESSIFSERLVVVV
jgi:hypothetical protein